MFFIAAMNTMNRLSHPRRAAVARPTLKSTPAPRNPFAVLKTEHPLHHLNLSALKKSGHFPTLVTSFLYFDYSFMVWTLLGVLANQIAAPESLNLSAQQRFFMVSVPILFGGIFRLALGLLVDRIGAKRTGIIAQLFVMTGLSVAWFFGLKNYEA